MQKWKYLILETYTFKSGNFLDEINRLGEIGWEIITPAGGSTNLILKRPLED